ncbi:MAG TPA: hypothetical protein VGF45_11425 [Polyangia bacterium]
MKLGKASFRLVELAVMASVVAGCGLAEEAGDEFRNGVPRNETVKVVVPESAPNQRALTAADTSSRQHALTVKGQTAELYQLTRAASGIVNGGAGLTLVLVKTIVSFPPTTVSLDSATWGPWTGALEPVTWKLTVTRVAPGKYDYVLAGRARGDLAGAFVTVLSGSHTPAVDGRGRPVEGFGTGDFTLDWDARRTLPMPEDDNVGKVTYHYERPDLNGPVVVNAEFRQVKDKDRPGQLVDLSYRYQSAATGGGMEFVHTAPMTSGKAGSRLAVKSRWTAAGAGRSDVRATGGDLPAGATAQWNECWSGNATFASTYQFVSWDPSKNYGVEASDCAFPVAEYSAL